MTISKADIMRLMILMNNFLSYGKCELCDTVHEVVDEEKDFVDRILTAADVITNLAYRNEDPNDTNSALLIQVLSVLSARSTPIIRKTNCIRKCFATNCHNVGDFKCSACNAAWYCSIECQRSDRQTHKVSCTFVKNNTQ